MNPLYSEETPAPTDAEASSHKSEKPSDKQADQSDVRTQQANKRTEEQTLVEKLRQGDPASYESFVRDNMPRVLAVTRRLLRDEQEAQDASQDAFLQAFRKMDTFKG